MAEAKNLLRRKASLKVQVGKVSIGGHNPIVVQSMTNTDTADVQKTVAQIVALSQAGSELVRVTVDRDEAAKAVPHIREKLDRIGIDAPIIGDFHYIGHKLLADNPACAEALAKYRINPLYFRFHIAAGKRGIFYVISTFLTCASATRIRTRGSPAALLLAGSSGVGRARARCG